MGILFITHNRLNCDGKKCKLFRNNVTSNYDYVACKKSLGIIMSMNTNLMNISRYLSTIKLHAKRKMILKRNNVVAKFIVPTV